MRIGRSVLLVDIDDKCVIGQRNIGLDLAVDVHGYKGVTASLLLVVYPHIGRNG